MYPKTKLVVLCVLDGWGIKEDYPGNAITHANTKNFNSLWFSYPHTLLLNSGRSVGLPENHVGNSEVGHLNMGAGKIVLQDLLRINLAIEDGSFFKNDALLKALEHARKNNSQINILGLAGLGSVHSEIGHLWAVLKLIKDQGFPDQRVNLHLFTDGRDSPPSSARGFVKSLNERVTSEKFGKIASISGRYYAMDRDNRWERTKEAYFAILGNSLRKFPDPALAIDDSYQNGITDEFIKPQVIVDGTGQPKGPAKEGDSFIFLNYRPDRARQLTKAFVLDDFSAQKTSSGETIATFERGQKLENIFFATMSQYEKDLPVSAIVFKPQDIAMPIARILSERGMRQLHIAETEKYAHVTYFFNGGREVPFAGEDRILIDSPKVASYTEKPEMSTQKVCETLIKNLEGRVYNFAIVNFAAPDMIAHTGNFAKTIEAVTATDKYLGAIVKTTRAKGGSAIITSDHGNAEELIGQNQGVDTAHNANPSPLILVDKNYQGRAIHLKFGLLADVAPTILGLLNIPKPSQMTGRNLLTL